MAAWVSWQAMLCLLMNWLLWVLHLPAMWVQESGNPHNGHAFVGASLYLYTTLLLYSWPDINFNMFMPFFGDLRM